MTPRILVLGYGSELRGDDGIGPWVARAVEAWGRPHVSARALHQLTPEVAAELAWFDEAIFVDACVGAGGDGPLALVPVEPQPRALLGAHSGTPGAVLALARALYERAASCWVIPIPVADTELGAPLSDAALRSGERALALLAGRVGATDKEGMGGGGEAPTESPQRGSRPCMRSG